MLRAIFTLFVLLHTSFCFAQNTARVTTTKISGTIKGNTLDSISLGLQKVAISPKGAFSFTAVVEKPQYQKLQYGQQELELYLEPGKNLVLACKAEEFPARVNFEGKLGIVNQYLQQQRELNEQVNAYLSNSWGAMFSKPEAAFIATVDSIRRLYLKPLNELLYKDRTLQPWFLIQQRADLTYPFDRWLLTYPEVHRRYTGEEISLSPKTEAYLYRINLNDPSQLEFESYRQFVRDYLYQIVQLEFMQQVDKKGMDNKWLFAAFKTLPRVIKHPQVREFWLYDYMQTHLEDYGPKNLDSLMAAFQEQVNDQEYRSNIQASYEQQKQLREKALSRVYRTVDGYDLLAFITLPEGMQEGERRPAMVYFHGGSGNKGKPDWHIGPSPWGFVNIAVEYRLRDRHGSLPPDQVTDAKAFFRWLRQHAGEFGVDTSRILGSGNSNGGYLLLNTAMAKGFDASGDSLKINPAPNALVLQAAAFDATVNNWWDKYLTDKAAVHKLSPTEHPRPNLPPMLVIHGTEDQSVPYHTAEDFVKKMKAIGNPVQLLSLQGSPHHLWAIPYFRNQANKVQEEWMRELGYIK